MTAKADQQLALRLCRALSVDTGRRPMQWRTLALIARRARIRDLAEIDKAVAEAVKLGWLLVEGGHSIALTDTGRSAARAP